jgi:hypothetical protein
MNRSAHQGAHPASKWLAAPHETGQIAAQFTLNFDMPRRRRAVAW